MQNTAVILIDNQVLGSWIILLIMQNICLLTK